jgi:hypothetical protein
MKFEVSTGVKIQVEVICVVVLCSVVVGYQHLNLLDSYLNGRDHLNNIYKLGSCVQSSMKVFLY